MSETGGFKLGGAIESEQELAKTQKAAGSAWTRLSAHVGSINPSEVAVDLCNVPVLLGGRPTQSDTNEHTHGGRSHVY